jgi:hypothetical protein
VPAEDLIESEFEFGFFFAVENCHPNVIGHGSETVEKTETAPAPRPDYELL